MELEIIAKYQQKFEQFVHNENDTEYWLARELQEDDHFIGVSKMVTIGSGAEREMLKEIKKLDNN